MARVRELKLPIVQVGIRAQCRDEAELIRSDPTIRTIYAHELRAQPTAQWVRSAVDHLTQDVYITIDADGFDPSIVPAVGTAEPNGLTWSEGLALLDAVCRNRRVVGFDIVEVAPVPGSTLSEYTMAKLAYKLIGLIARGPVKGQSR
jgi:agmatinase